MPLEQYVELGYLLGLGLITIAVIAAVIVIGRMISKRVRTETPQSELNVQITLTGTVLFAVVVGFWIICMAARTFAPERPFGAFVSRTDGLLAVLVTSIFAAGVAVAILEWLGYPITKRD